MQESCGSEAGGHVAPRTVPNLRAHPRRGEIRYALLDNFYNFSRNTFIAFKSKNFI
jgi:hypothetical protein